MTGSRSMPDVARAALALAGAGVTLGVVALTGTITAPILALTLSASAASYASYLLRKDTDPKRDLTGRLLVGPVAPRRWVLGRARTGGHLLWYDEFYKPNSRHNLRRAWMVMAISEGEIDAIEKVYIDGREVRVIPDATGTTFVPHPSGWTSAISDLRARKTALGCDEPGGSLDPKIAEACADLDAEIADLGAEDEFAWYLTDDDGNQLPAFRITVDKGGSGKSDADRRALGETTHSNDPDGIPAALPNWTANHKLDGVAWALVELLAWDNGEDKRSSWNSIPVVEFLVKGIKPGGTWTENAASLAAWYLKERVGLTDDDLDGVAAAETVCGATITVPNVAEGTTTGLITAQQVLELLYGTDQSQWPATEVRTKVLAEWNSRFAGSQNARPRYYFNGVITGSQSREELEQQFAQAMVGSLVKSGGKVHFRPGTARTASATISEADIVDSQVSWSTEPPATDLVNATTCRLAQDSGENWNESIPDKVEDTDLVTRDGYFERDIGYLSGVTDRFTAYRIQTLYLRINAPGLRRCALSTNGGANLDHAILVPGDTVTLSVPSEGLSDELYRILDKRVDMSGRVTFSLIEEPSGTWADSLAPLGRFILGRRYSGGRRLNPGRLNITSIGVEWQLKHLAQSQPLPGGAPGTENNPLAGIPSTDERRYSGFSPILHLSVTPDIKRVELEATITNTGVNGTGTVQAHYLVTIPDNTPDNSFTIQTQAEADPLVLDPTVGAVFSPGNSRIDLSAIPWTGTGPADSTARRGPRRRYRLASSDRPEARDLKDYAGDAIAAAGEALVSDGTGWTNEPRVVIYTTENPPSVADYEEGTIVAKQLSS